MPKAVTFVWPHAGAESVALAGSFNGWSPEPMRLDSDGMWKLEKGIEHPGPHQYKFVVDGDWVHDEGQDHVCNEMGSQNNVCKLAADNAPIEVEKKFVVPKHFEELLLDRGYKEDRQFSETIVDEYVDTPDYTIMACNHWLRMRNGDWELKYPVGSPRKADSTALYHESTNVEDIQSRLRPILARIDHPDPIPEDSDDLPPVSLAGMVEDKSLATFARLQTVRKTFKLEDVSVVVDEAEWGYRVGEIEIIVNDVQKVPGAIARIQEIADDMEFVPFNPSLLAKHLVSSH